MRLVVQAGVVRGEQHAIDPREELLRGLVGQHEDRTEEPNGLVQAR